MARFPYWSSKDGSGEMGRTIGDWGFRGFREILIKRVTGTWRLEVDNMD